MAGKINNSPPPDADFGMVDASGRVKISPVWYRFLTTKQDAGEILVEGSVTGGVLDSSVQPPTITTALASNMAITATNLTADTEANRTNIVQLLLPTQYSRIAVDVWVTGRFSAYGTTTGSVAVFGNVLVSGEDFAPSLYGASANLFYVASGPADVASFTTNTLSEVVEAGAPGRVYKFMAKKEAASGDKIASVSQCTMYLKITKLS